MISQNVTHIYIKNYYINKIIIISQSIKHIIIHIHKHHLIKLLRIKMLKCYMYGIKILENNYHISR